MNVAADSVEKCIDAFLDGQPIDVPAEMESQYASAIAAHRALKDFLEATLDASDANTSSRLPPKISGDYEIEHELGSGGMGVVYLARQKSLHRHVAIKVLRPRRELRQQHVSRFLEEARHLANLRHPNIVPVHEIGDAEGEPYFTMDFIDGEPLSAIIARGALTPSRAVAIARQVMLAVQHAHRQGVIHRDLKPGNVLVDKQGGVFVTDFGLARNIASDSNLTQTGDILGTPQYMSPEQARGDTKLIGEASDLHAIGLILFEMLTGKPPFTASNTLEVVRKIASEEAPLLRKIDRRIPRDLETICLKCLQKAPANRYANATAFLVDLQRYERGEPLVAKRPGILHHVGNWIREHWTIAAAVLITAAIAVGVAATMIEKPYRELVTWGDEELAQGNASTAATVYTRAFHKADDQEKKQLVGRFIDTCKQLDDSKKALDLALLILPLAPRESFGKHDYIIAQALVTKQRTSHKQGGLNLWSGAPKEELLLVKTRLSMALQQTITEKQKLELEESYAAVNLAINEGEPYVRYTPDDLGQLPQGTMEELTKQMNDAAAPVWNRGRAAMAVGLLQKESGQKGNALQSLLFAYQQMKSIYPMYAGVKAGSTSSDRELPDAEECQLVRQLVKEIEAMAPESIPKPEGQLEFSVKGVDLPERIRLSLHLRLFDPSVKDPFRGLPRSLPAIVPLSTKAPVRIEVLDGTYRVESPSYSLSSAGADVDSFSPRLQVDFTSWPKEVTVKGGLIQLPPIQLRLAEEVIQLTPKNGDSIDLNKEELTWTPLPNAVSYAVHMIYREEDKSGGQNTTFFAHLKTTSPTLRFTDLADLERKSIRDNLTLGKTGGWRVYAYDEHKQCIGVAMREHWFLVAGELNE